MSLMTLNIPVSKNLHYKSIYLQSICIVQL